jgi:amino acid adenylation domain-containing protein
MPSEADRATGAFGARTFTVGGEAPSGPPDWLAPVAAEFVDNVADRRYPCHFGRQSFLSADLYGTWLGASEQTGSLAAELASFVDATAPFPDRRSVLACFFEPEAAELPHTWYADRFWSVLDALHSLDAAAWPSDVPAAPADAAWEFCFHGTPMFVFAATPTHTLRPSRRLGPGMVALFQPRSVFRGVEGGTPGGIAARRRIRAQLREWDLVPPHPVMGDYGDPAHPEWKQYFIGDHERPMFSECPIALADKPCLHEMVRLQARQTPDALALIAGDTVLDYRTLERRVDDLAAQLMQHGVGPEDRVGVMADRSAETVVSILAALTAGACYVPVDPAYPEARRALLLDQAGVEVVVTPRRLAATVPLGPRWLMLSDEPPSGSQPRLEPRQPPVRPDNLAYVIYTSGSTGVPKGVAISHRQIVHAIAAEHDVERPWPEAFLMPISFSFDASGVGIYWTLTSGGCIVIPGDDEHNDPERLRALIRRYGITHSDCTPSLYDMLLGDDPTPLRSLRCVQVGGEVCPPELVDRHRRLLPDCVFENNYGPTEAAIWSTTNVIDRAHPFDGETVSIGHAVPGARVYLLDDALAPVRVGDVGEIYVGGGGVARGYLDRPAMTAERFLPDPFSGLAGGRMYRTGDAARELRDGSLDFAGRRDGQVKVRGYRIELGEIENALRRHPDVAEATVDVRQAGAERILVGYLRAAPDARCSDVALISHLAPLLPDHMVPRRFVFLDEMPRLVSGKVDRARLPNPPRIASSIPARPVAAGASR